jgi:hypothetical protein
MPPRLLKRPRLVSRAHATVATKTTPNSLRNRQRKRRPKPRKTPKLRKRRQRRRPQLQPKMPSRRKLPPPRRFGHVSQQDFCFFAVDTFLCRLKPIKKLPLPKSKRSKQRLPRSLLTTTKALILTSKIDFFVCVFVKKLMRENYRYEYVEVEVDE